MMALKITALRCWSSKNAKYDVANPAQNRAVEELVGGSAQDSYSSIGRPTSRPKALFRKTEAPTPQRQQT